MARRSLKPQLNQIRAWVQQGRTDAWIAHQLEVSATELREFRKQHNLTPDTEEAGSQEVDLRDEIEAEIEAATVEETDDEEEASDAEEDTGEESDEDADAESDEESGDEEPERGEARRQRPRRSGTAEKSGAGRSSTDGGERGEGSGRPRRRRRRGKRGGRGRRRELEATFDHGERDGYGLWLDPTVKDNPVYAEHWAGKREVTVRVEADQIVIRRAGSGDPGDSGN